MPKMNRNTIERKYFEMLSVGAMVLFVTMVVLYVIGWAAGQDMGDMWILVLFTGILTLVSVLLFRYARKLFNTRQGSDEDQDHCNQD